MIEFEWKNYGALVERTACIMCRDFNNIVNDGWKTNTHPQRGRFYFTLSYCSFF